MNGNKKTIFVLAIGLGGLLTGLFLSGYLALLFLGLDTDLLKWNTYPAYLKALDLPQVQPYVGKLRVAGYLGFGLPLLACLVLLILMFKPVKKAMHGDARFANAGDLARQGMFKSPDNGIVVGKFNGKLVRLGGQQFVILAAPTRSGKGVGIVIPNLLDYQESMVVLDIKQENFDLTSGWRASQGQEIYLFNPFAEDRRTHRWNPLSYVSEDPAFRISELQSIAAMLYPEGSDDQKFWVSQARNAFTAFALFLFENFDEQWKQGFPKEFLAFPTLGSIYRLSSGDGSELKAYLQALSKKPFLSSHAKTAFANMLSQAEETFASILGTFKEPLNAFINPVLDAATSGNDFLLTDVRKRKMTIYIGIQPNKLAESRLIVNLFFSQIINLNTKELPQSNPELKHQCLLLMDEFTAIGKVEIIASAVAYMAGYNLRLLPIIQSMSQLDSTYGKDVSRTIITNHALQIIYAPREQQDANDYSDMLGYTTVLKRNRSQSHGQQGNVTFSEAEERRALMLPQELRAMGFDKEVFLYEGIAHPVMCEKIKYYQDKYFTRRLLPKVEVKKLEMGEKPVSNKAVQAVTAAVSIALAMTATACSSEKAESSAVSEQSEQHSRAAMADMQDVVSEELEYKPANTREKFDGIEYKRNPNPKQRYEMTMIIDDAPGSYVASGHSLQYDVVPDGCLPSVDNSLGVQYAKTYTHLPLTLKKIADNTYVGLIDIDAMLEEDVYGNGVCHWKLAGIFAQLDIEVDGKHFDVDPSLRYTPEMLISGQVSRSYFWRDGQSRRDPEDPSAWEAQGPKKYRPELKDIVFSVTISSRAVAP